MPSKHALQRPRIFGIAAEDTDIVAIFRRGPSRWAHVGAWHIASASYSPGAWLYGVLYPQRCDLSPDGELLCYMALHASRWSVGETYIAVSRLPWLTALAAWPTFGTWSRGGYFVRNSSVLELGPPKVGDVEGLRGRYGIAEAAPHSFAVERRRGWTETADTPPRLGSDMWDERRGARVRMQKPAPGQPALTLRVHGRYAAFRDGQPSDCNYELVADGQVHPLLDVQWAEWDRQGNLLVATVGGHLQILDVQRGLEVLSDVDLSMMSPDPTPPPVGATSW
jgi:hypothetical protein